MHITSLEAGAITTAFGGILGATLTRLQQRAASKRAARDTLHRNVNDLLAASAEMLGSFAALRSQHQSWTGRWVQRVLLLVMDVVARGGLEFVGAPRQGERSRSKPAFLSTLPAMGGASVTLLQWDREATDSIRLAASSGMSQLWRATAALRLSGDAQFQQQVEDFMSAVEGVQDAYGKNDRRWASASGQLNEAIRDLVDDATRVTTPRWRRRFRHGRTH